MIFSDKFVFLELARTGSTYARYVLKQIPNSVAVGRKHNIYDDLSSTKKKLFREKNKVGTVRNPFEFYVSLYAFCCEKRGGLYERITYKPDFRSYFNFTDLFKILYLHFKYKSEWKKIVNNKNSVENFKLFMEMLLNINPEAYGNHYGLSGLNYVGFLSFNYLRLYNYDFIHNCRDLGSIKELEKYDQQHNFIDLMLINKTINEQLLESYKLLANSKEVVQKAINLRPKRSNTSTKKKPFKEYYDQELINLINEKEAFLLDKYNFKF
jgi:hypothetical protein